MTEDSVWNEERTRVIRWIYSIVPVHPSDDGFAESDEDLTICKRNVQ